MQISLTKANNRLKRVVDAGAFHRDRVASPEQEGKESMYRVPEYEAAASAH